MEKTDSSLFSSALYTPLLQALKGRIERGTSLRGRLTLSKLSPEERDAIDALLGRKPSRGQTLSLDLDQLDEQIRAAGIATSLEQAVIDAIGPVKNRRAESERLFQEWENVFETAFDLPGEFLEYLRTTGLLKRLAVNPNKALYFVDRLRKLVEVLPVSGEPLPSLAARLFGDSHALDPGRPLGTLGLCLARHLGEKVEGESRRSIWAAVGVLCDELSQPALVLNLPSASEHPLGDLLRIAREVGEPLHLSLRLLLRYRLVNDLALSGQTIFVCENPCIVTLAAAELGKKSRPLICIQGEAATPAQTLLQQMKQAGAKLYYHGDFDWPGIGIATRIFERFGAKPWRFTAADYRAAPKGKKLAGAKLETFWDPELADLMEQTGSVVHEEAVGDLLIEDLGN